MDIKTKLFVTKIFDNNLLAIRKNKVTLTLNKQANVEICNLDLRKVLMYEFNYDYIKVSMETTQDYYSQTLIV